MAVRAHLLKIDGRVLGGMQFGGAGAGAVLGVTVHACFCILTVGCKGACSLGCWGRWRSGMLFGVRLGVWGGGCCLGCS